MLQNNQNNMQQFQEEPSHTAKKSPYLTKKAGALIAALCILASGSAGYAAGVFSAAAPQAVSNSAQPLPAAGGEISTMAAAGSASGALSVTEIAEKAADSVVEVTTEITQYDSFMRQYVAEGAGSGVILSQDGYIVTNNHVIEGASSIKVTLRDGTSYPAVLVGTDAQGDIAVIKIDASGLKAAEIGDSDALQVGDTAVAVGNPLGQLGGTVTDGIISALDREIDIDGKTMTLLQTNAAINPGNSGGGLFNDRGELIGVVVAKSSGSGIEGLGFAIPINTAVELIDDIMQFGYVQGRVDLGMTTTEVTGSLMSALYGYTGGLYIDEVNPGSNAEEVGFRSGDRIVSFNGAEISSQEDLTRALSACSVGDTVEIVIERSGRQYVGELTLEEAHA